MSPSFSKSLRARPPLVGSEGIATFEFACGEYEQTFEKAFYANDEGDLEKNKQKY